MRTPEASAFAAKGESTTTADDGTENRQRDHHDRCDDRREQLGRYRSTARISLSSVSFSDTNIAFGQGFATTDPNVVGPSFDDLSQPDMTQVDADPGATILTPNLLVQAVITWPQARSPSLTAGVLSATTP